MGREPNFGRWGSLLFVSPATDTIILLFLSYARKKRAVFYRTLYELMLL
jgi:hypothetical protein